MARLFDKFTRIFCVYELNGGLFPFVPKGYWRHVRATWLAESLRLYATGPKIAWKYRYDFKGLLIRADDT